MDSMSSDLDLQSLIENMEKEKTGHAKSIIFVTLMTKGYVLLHKLLNEGEKYDDKRQTKRFSLSLSDEVIIKINKME